MQGALVTYFGLGLLCNAALLLSFDLVAEHRGASYMSAITDHARSA